MFAQFVGSLILITFVLSFLIKLLAIPFAALWALTSRYDTEQSVHWSILLNQIVFSITLSAFIAVVSLFYSSSKMVRHWWVYALAGFVVTYLSLGSNAHERRKELAQYHYEYGHVPVADMGAVHGAEVGMFAGLIAYPVIYVWPQLIMVIPGAPTLFEWTIRVAEWVTQFWLVRVILGFAVLAYVWQFGLMAVIGGAMLVHAGLARVKRLIGSAVRQDTP